MRRLVLRYIFFITATLVIIAIDQVTKQMAYQHLFDKPPVDVLPVLQWALVFNRGAAFGFLSDAGGIQHYLFSGLAMLISVILLVWIWRVCTENVLLAVALMLLLSGAVGNLIDRLTYQFVIDFINLHYGGWYFPAFNVADMAITFGACALIADSFGLNLSKRADAGEKNQADKNESKNEN